jgi:hypothetical protein
MVTLAVDTISQEVRASLDFEKLLKIHARGRIHPELAREFESLSRDHVARFAMFLPFKLDLSAWRG